MTKNQKKLFDAVRNLSEIDSRLSRNADLKSLSTGKMSNFLFEEDEGIKNKKTREDEDGDTTEVVKNLEQAIAALTREVQGLEKVSVALKSPEVKRLAETLNSKLAEVQIKKALKNPGAWDKFRQKSLKQVVYLANSVSQARHDIKTVINSALEALKALGVPLDSETKITDMFPENPKERPPYQFKTKITKEEFKKGIINKLGESGKSGVLSFFKNLMGSIKLDKSVVINPEFFSNNILFNTPKELSEVYKQPIISEPSATKIDDSVRAATEAAPKDASDKSGEAASKGADASKGENKKKFSDIIKLDQIKAGDALKARMGDKWDKLSPGMKDNPDKVAALAKLLLPAMSDAGILKYESKEKSQKLILERLNELAGTSTK